MQTNEIKFSIHTIPLSIKQNGPNHPVSIDYKYHDINDFNKIITNKNSTFARLHLNIALLSKHFDYLHNYLTFLNNSIDFIGISEYKISKNLIIINFYLLGYAFCYNECKSCQGGTGLSMSTNLIFKLQYNFFVNKPGKKEKSFVAADKSSRYEN